MPQNPFSDSFITEFSEVPSIEEGGLGLLLKAPASAFER
jgi:hypothetical protein